MQNACRARAVFRFLSLAGAGLLLGIVSLSAQKPGTDQRLPTLFIIGDSTVRNNTKGQVGWGDPLVKLFDKSKIKIENRALGGRSSRTYLTEGLWDKVLAGMKPGDFVLMQFGHNDGGPLDSGRARASLKGVGEETREIVDAKTGKKEVVHTYGRYMRKYVTDAKSKGATPIVLSPIPRNIWKDNKVARAAKDYGKWAAEAARAEGAAFIDLNDVVARRYEELGAAKVDALFGGDHTHTNLAGAQLNASLVAGELRALKNLKLGEWLVGTGPGESNLNANKPLFQFQFGPGKSADGYIQIAPTTAYTKELSYGFDLGSKVTAIDRGGANPVHAGFCTSDQPIYFSADLPEGNYDVIVTLGDLKEESSTTVRAESRRLLLENVHTLPGQFVTRTFTTNIRNSKLASGGHVKLKDREKGVLHWDDKLTIEFRGKRPCVCALAIVKNDSAVTVYLAGDSTVTDQVQKNETFTSWGQILPRFFKPGVVAIANHAESGEATTTFIGARRLDKILETMKKGDYLLVQFGHNDQNQKRDITTYKNSLKRYLDEARQRGATPVLVTPMQRRAFDGDGKVKNSLAGYPDAVRQTAQEEKVALIDLDIMSRGFYEALGPAGSKSAFVDNTHTNPYGAYEFARYIADTIKHSELDLAKFVVDDLPPANFKAPTSQE